jgi:hypothetical protein
MPGGQKKAARQGRLFHSGVKSSVVLRQLAANSRQLAIVISHQR